MPKDEFVLLTGSASKLGKHIAELLAEKKYNILLHYFKSKKETDLLSKKLNNKFKNQKFFPVYIDLSKVNSKNKFKNLIPKKTNLIGVINNASLYFEDTIENFKFEDYQKNMNIHYRNPLTLTSIIFENYKNTKLNYFVINVTDNDLDNEDYYSYSKTKSMLSEHCSEVSEIDIDRIKILEFKPKKILPSKDSSKNIALFKQEFVKLLK
ncbi:MAG: hypothetical protein CL762_04025 [Chloroflexi bacterium]|nr:hypothetical protein [Chloroflexota bacterium]|tara:strand:+ start:13803 stop:14429 length:627 start_codon:yes stop_codon:yes gene_type:complete